MRHRNVIQTPVVSFDQLVLYALTLKFLSRALRTLTMSTEGCFANCSKLKTVFVNQTVYVIELFEVFFQSVTQPYYEKKSEFSQ